MVALIIEFWKIDQWEKLVLTTNDLHFPNVVVKYDGKTENSSSHLLSIFRENIVLVRQIASSYPYTVLFIRVVSTVVISITPQRRVQALSIAAYFFGADAESTATVPIITA